MPHPLHKANKCDECKNNLSNAKYYVIISGSRQRCPSGCLEVLYSQKKIYPLERWDFLVYLSSIGNSIPPIQTEAQTSSSQQEFVKNWSDTAMGLKWAETASQWGISKMLVFANSAPLVPTLASAWTWFGYKDKKDMILL